MSKRRGNLEGGGLFALAGAHTVTEGGDAGSSEAEGLAQVAATVSVNAGDNGRQVLTPAEYERKTRRGHSYRGLYVCLDGPDGAGKGTQVAKLQRYLESQGYEIVQVREPGGTKTGDHIRHLLLNHEDVGAMSDTTELLLFEAARAQLVDEVIIPALEAGKIVLADRSFDSTTAYQGAAGKLSLERVIHMNEVAMRGIKPDRSYFQDIDVETSVQRRAGNPDRMERKKKFYHQRVVEAFRAIALLEPERVVLVDARRDPDTIHQEIVNDLNLYIEEYNLRDRLLKKCG